MIPYSLRDNVIKIGRNPKGKGLILSMKINNEDYSEIIPETDNSPTDITKCNVDKGLSHCTITVGSDGIMNLSNDNPLNKTFLKNVEIEKCHVLYEDSIQLGNQRYGVSVKHIIDCALEKKRKIDPGTFPLDGLEKVWEEYIREKEKIEKRKTMISVFASIPMICSMGVTVLSDVCKWKNVVIPSIVVFMIFLFFFVIRLLELRKGSTKKNEELNQKMTKEYVCPNPDCRHPIPLTTPYYRLTRSTEKCTNCKCSYTFTHSGLSKVKI